MCPPWMRSAAAFKPAAARTAARCELKLRTLTPQTFAPGATRCETRARPCMLSRDMPSCCRYGCPVLKKGPSGNRGCRSSPIWPHDAHGACRHSAGWVVLRSPQPWRRSWRLKTWKMRAGAQWETPLQGSAPMALALAQASEGAASRRASSTAGKALRMLAALRLWVAS